MHADLSKRKYMTAHCRTTAKAYTT